jgi:uncharacterized protein (DUF362 family)
MVSIAMVEFKPVSDSLRLQASSRPSVHVAHGNGAYANARCALENVDLSTIPGKRVLLKPNAGRVAAPGSGVTTHPDVVAAAIDVFREAGADVAIGESPILGVKVREAFESTGIASVANQRDCPLIDMDRRRFVEVSIPDGRAIHSLRVCPEALEFDFIVSLPVMKMHMHTGVTLAVKNMKGCLWRRSKAKLHMLPPLEGNDEKPIDVAIADLSSVLRPSFTIIDGTVGMEGLGPSAGQAKSVDTVVASADAFAADAVACQLMGTDAERIPHLRMGAERGYGEIDLARMTITPGNWRDWIAPFAPPPETLKFEFPNVSVLDDNSCSACQSTLLLFLKHHKDRIFDYFPGRSTINIAIGKGHADPPEGTLCIGNCTANLRNIGIFVPGCPPIGSEILKAISVETDIDCAAGDNRRIDEESP